MDGLTTVVARISLNMLRSRNSRREKPLGVHVPEPIVDPRRREHVPDADLDAQREVVEAFLAAARDVVLRADLGPLPAGGSREIRGAAAVAGQALTYSRLGLLTQPALINGAAGWSRREQKH